MQEKYSRGLRYGIIGTIAAATLGAALFSGCSQDNNSESKNNTSIVKKDNIYPVQKTDYGNAKVKNESPATEYQTPKDNIEVIAEGPELFDPRVNINGNLEQKVQIQEPLKTISPEPVQIQTPVPNYQVPKEPYAQPAQPLQPIQTPRTNDYQQPRDYQTAPLPATPSYQTPAQAIPNNSSTPSYQPQGIIPRRGQRDY